MELAMGDKDLLTSIVSDAVTGALKTSLRLIGFLGVAIIGLTTIYLENMRTDIKEVAKEQIIIRTNVSKMEAEYMSLTGRISNFDTRFLRLEDKF